MSEKVKKAADIYANNGFRLVLLYGIHDGVCTCTKGSACTSAGKHPVKQNWQAESVVTADLTETTNLGIITGRVSSIFVIDIDPRHGGDSSLSNLVAKYGGMPRTITASSGGGGMHYYFRYPQGLKISNRVNLFDGIDIRSDGGLIVAPPSQHQSGRPYRWQEGLSPADITPADAPAWLISLITSEDRKPTQAKGKLPEVIPEGMRNVSLTSLAGSMRRRGSSREGILAALREENNRCATPLEDVELERIATSIARYEPAPAELEWDDETRKMLESRLANIKDYANIFDPEMISLLSLASQKDPAIFAGIKQKLKGKVNLNDLERVIKHYLKENREQLAQSETMLNLAGLDTWQFAVPNGWKVSMEEGLTRMSEGRNLCVCFVPLVITRRFRNIDTGLEKIEMSFHRDFHWRMSLAPRSVVFNRNSALRLNDSGLPITSNNAGEIISYLTDFESANQAVIPVVDSVSRLGWMKDGGFFPFHNSGDYQFESDSKESMQILEGLETVGNEKTWLDMAIEARSSPAVRFLIASSFASVLVEPLRKRVFFIHIWHNSRSGKTAALKLAISVWGNPLKLIGSFNSTIVGLERMAAALRNLPFGIDELQVLNTKRITTDSVIYMLAQGQGRTRGGKDGGLQDLAIWRNIILTTGEEALLGNSTQDGANSRTFEIYARPVADVSLASSMHEISEQHYGHAGKVFIEKLFDELKTIPDLLKSLFEIFKSSLIIRYPDSIHINEVAMVCLGDYLSATYVFNERPDEAMSRAIETSLLMLEQNRQLTQDDNIDRAWAFVSGWIIANQSKFNSMSAPPLYGKIDEHGDYLVIPAYLHKALEDAGFSTRKVFRGFGDRGYIKGCEDPDGTKRLQQQRRIDGKRCRVYVIQLGEDVPDEDEGYLE